MEPNNLVPGYQQDDTLKLDIIESHHDALSSTEIITAQVAQVMTATMSPVMLVTLKTPNAPNRAILKLYNRRFGSSLRRSKKGKHLPCRVQDEAAFRSFVDRGDIGPFMDEMEKDRRTELLPNWAADRRLESGGQAKSEAALWWEAGTHFETEIEAYKRLKDLEGVFIPRVYASVRFSPTSASTSEDIDDYHSVNGILLQFIPGWSLWDLPESPSSPTSPQEWTSIVQRVVQGAHGVNKRDIILKASCPRNVVVDADSHLPFIIDLAQCYFMDQLFKDWEHFGFGDGQEDWTPEAEWSESLRSLDNPGSIGLLAEQAGEGQGVLD